MNLLRRLSQRCRQWAACFVVTLAAASPAVAGLDNYSTGPGVGPGDGMCDVWQAIYNGWGLLPGNDEDKDGCSNLIESISGTDPRLAGDCLKVGNLVISASNVVFTFDAEAGKRYRVLSDNSPGGPFTTTVQLTAVNGVPQSIAAYVPTANATGQTLSVAKDPASRKFYKVQVSDIDSDLDGVSDWAERRTGRDPNSTTTNGVSDFAFFTEQLALSHEVNIMASTPFAFEDGPQSGALKISRAQTMLPITVDLTVSGTATPVSDYLPVLPASVTLPAGSGEVTLFVNPQQNAPATEGSESVTVTLEAPAPSASFSLGANKTATVIINDTTVAAGTGLLAQFYDHSNSVYDHAANFGDAALYTYTRSGTTPNFTGVTVVTPLIASSIASLQVGHQVKLTFTAGNLNTVVYNHQNYTVTAKTATTFTITMPPGAGLPANSTGSACNFSIQSFSHPGVVTRTDPGVDFNWFRGTPNDATITGNDTGDNFSSVWEAYLQPTTTGTYQFQLDADDKARVQLDLDQNGTFELVEQIIEHGWDGPATVGTFQVSNGHALTAGQRYRIRVEHVETADEARCRLQWRAGTAAFANIPQANTFSHSEAMTANYNYTRVSSTPGAMTGTIVVTLNGHGLAVSNVVNLAFSSGNLFTPTNGDFHGNFSITAADTNTFTVNIAAGTLPVSGAGAGFVLNRPASVTTGWFTNLYGNAFFAGAPGFVGVQSAGATTADNGLYGSGSPDPLIHKNTFSARWTGQVQPQFTEEYTFSVLADDGFRLWVNGQELSLSLLASVNLGSSTYTYDTLTGETTVNYSASNIEPGSVGLGDAVRLDPTGGTITGFATTDLIVTQVVSPTVFKVTFPAGFGDQIVASTINMDALNRKIKPWVSNVNERFVRIPMIGGVRYDIKLEHWENTGAARTHLYWASHSQPKQVIPAGRLYPSSETAAPPAHLSTTDATALVGGPFSHMLLGGNGANVSISGAPAWLNYNSLTGELSGTPTAAGSHQIVITLTGPAGTSTSVLNLSVANTGGTIARQLWSGVAGTTVASIPTGTNPTSTSNLSSLQGPTGAGPNYGARIRGYITAPETGNYYFWIAANNAAELWISNDAEPVNTFKRAWVTTGSATPLTYGGEANQKSAWLALEQGKRYYIEILHKAGTGTGDNLAVGWAKPGQDFTTPSEIVPGYVLSPYVAPAPGSTGGTLYVATMLAQAGAVPQPPKTRVEGVGTATLSMNETETIAFVRFNHSNLTGSGLTDWHVHADPYLANPSAIIFDGVEPVTPGDGLQPDGSHKWTIAGVGGLTISNIRELIKQGKAYINLHTQLNPNGEIRGNFTLANGSRTFTPPPAPPAWTNDNTNNDAAVRFLTQATYGANTVDIAALKGMASYDAWINDQFTQPVSVQLPEVLERERSDQNGGGQFTEVLTFNAWWRNSVTGPDQLRQRLAFALSEILVVSAAGPLDNRADCLSYYYDILANNAFGNFRQLLEEVTLSPSMGRYLDMRHNDKPDVYTGKIPNENYAREIKQLFSIGLFRMWPDGTLILNSKDEVIPTYTQREIVGLAHVLTGWDDGYDGAYRTTIGAPDANTRQMREIPARHFTGNKRVLNNEVMPGLRLVGSQPLDALATHNSMYFNDPAYQALPSQELAFIHDQLFNHPNTGPFVCRQLIQRLVTSHPSRDYLYRVVQKFNDNGSGVRGDLKAVIKAILLDYEARHSQLITVPAYGKQREAVLRTTSPARAFRLDGVTGSYAQPVGGSTGGHVIRVTAANHKLVAGRSVFLEFPRTWTVGDITPASAPYIVLTTPAPTANDFYVNAKGWVGVSTTDGNANGGITGTYSQPASSAVLTITLSGHWLPAGGSAYLDFEVPVGPAISDGVYTAATSTSTNNTTGGTTFTITNATNATARSGRVRMVGFQGSYAVANSNLAAPFERRITLDTTDWTSSAQEVDHHLINLPVGDPVFLNFTQVAGAASMPLDAQFIVETVPDANTFTVLTSLAGTGGGTNASRNGMWMFPLVNQPMTRSGTVNKLSSTFQVNSTDGDIDQSPLNAPTVFNYYLPDYKYPGTLASQGLTTPEFQSTAETTVVRQSNFFYNGIFNPSGDTNGISSFRTGQHALVLDFSPWMGNAVSTVGTVGAVLGAGPQTGQVWTSNANLPTLIQRLNTLLLAGQLSTTAQDKIRNFVGRQIATITTGNPCTISYGTGSSNEHGLQTGDSVTIVGVTGGTFIPSINGTFTITKVTNNTFTVPVNYSVSGATLTNSSCGVISYTNSGPSATNIRDRLRAVIHLILSSPDYIIQR